MNIWITQGFTMEVNVVFLTLTGETLNRKTFSPPHEIGEITKKIIGEAKDPRKIHTVYFHGESGILKDLKEEFDNRGYKTIWE